MPSLQIRDLPEDIYRTLLLRAERENRSLAQQATADLGRAPELENRSQRLATLERIAGEMDPDAHLSPSPEDLIREDRDR
jgi:plasmid stability protein